MRQRVVDEDTHHLRHALGIALRPDRSVGQAHLELGLVAREHRGELLADPTHERSQVGALGMQLECARLELRQVKEAGGQRHEAIDLLAQLAEEALARLVVEVLVLEQLEEAAEREQRGAQLVRGGGDEALAR